MKKLTSVILSLLLILVLVTGPGATSTLLAQAEENQTETPTCNPSEKIAWLWGLLDITVEAPDFVFFYWPDGTYEQAAFYDYDPVKKIAYYRTTNNLNVVPDGWGSDEASEEQLADLFYECPEPTVTTVPSVTTEVSESITPSVTTEVTVSVSPSVTVTESVTPSVEVTTSVTPTEEVTREEESETTETPTPTTTVEPTNAPAANNTGVSNTGGVSNIVPASTSPVAASSAPSTAQVLGAKTMAKAGAFDQTVMNLSGIFGMLFTAAGSLIYAKRRTTKNA